MISSLFKLLKEDTQVVCNEACQEAFSKLKCSCSVHLLWFLLHLSHLWYAVGCVLGQDDKSGRGKENLVPKEEVSRIKVKIYYVWNDVMCFSLGYTETRALHASCHYPTGVSNGLVKYLLEELAFVTTDSKMTVLIGKIWYFLCHLKIYQKPRKSSSFGQQSEWSYEPMTSFFPDESILIIELDEDEHPIGGIFQRGCKYLW